MFTSFFPHRVQDFVGDVMFSTKLSSPYDFAVVRLRGSVAEAVVPRMAQSFVPGLISVFFFRGDVIDILGDSHFFTLMKLVFGVAPVSAGDSVIVVGYGGLGRSCGPSLTCGVLSKAIRVNDQPVMLQTSCAVQAGSSGGAVVRRRSGELLGKKSRTCKVMYCFWSVGGTWWSQTTIQGVCK